MALIIGITLALLKYYTYFLKKSSYQGGWLETCRHHPFVNVHEVVVCVFASFLPEADVF